MLTRYRTVALSVLVGTAAGCGGPEPTGPPAEAAIGTTTTSIQVYGAWHCGNDYCTWATVRDMVEFDRQNHWLVYGNGGKPAVNLVVLSFVHPLRLLNLTTDAQTLGGIPRGMTAEIVKYFTDHGIRVMLSMGGITYVDAWNQALAKDAQ